MGAEGFAGVAGGDAAVDDGGLEVGKGRLGFAIGGEPAGKAAEEGVTGTGGVKDGVQRVSGAGKEVVAVFTEEEAAVFTTLDDDEAWAFGLKATSGFHEVGGACEFFSLAIIDDQEVDLFQDFMQALIGDADPQVHGIGGDKISTAALLQGLKLVVRAHVGQDGDFGSRSSGGEIGCPGFQHVDGHVVGGPAVHVVMVFATPGEGGTAAALQAIEGDTFAAQQIQMSLREVMTDDAHEVYIGGENAGRQGCVRGGTAEEILLRILRGFDVVQGDGSGDDD